MCSLDQMSIDATPPQPPVQTQEQKEFMDLMNRLFLAIHEVVYTSNLLDDDIVEKHPELQDLKRAVRNLGKIAWKFQKLVKRMAEK